MRTAIYARKSTESEDRQVQSLEDQKRELFRFAKREGLPDPVVYEEARSAKAPDKRPEFTRLLNDVETGEIDVILVWAFNRLARNPVDGGRIAWLLQTGKLTMIRTPERTYKPDDNALLIAIEGGMATEDLRNLRRNVNRGLESKIERGWHSAKAPIGYLNDPLTREIVPDPVRFPLVRLGWEMMLAGHSVADVHRELLRRGLTTSTRRKAPRPVSNSRVHTIFRDPFYVGEIPWRGKRYAGRHEPMVTREQFDAVRRRLDSTPNGRLPLRRSFPYSGVFRCAVCGCSVLAERRVKHYPQSNRSAEYVYYHCTGSKGCPKSGIREEVVTEFVERTAASVAVPEPIAIWLTSTLTQKVESEGTATAATVSAIKERIANWRTKSLRLTEMRAEGEITREEFASLKSDYEKRLDGALADLARAESEGVRKLAFLTSKIDAAVEVGKLSARPSKQAPLAQALARCGRCLLNLGNLEIRLDPVIEKITAFEPLRNGSEKPKYGDLIPLDSVWWRLVDDLLNLAAEEVGKRSG